ncbi:hypothetical protein FDG2_5905 [Candidatus Protofrankia californiensis]|uniref:Uncharacterized protein n=1 Tax=Candidatus Protofrankia californiensis TaxID=1839754 RepID=A0A1C3PGF5_9ACTN|nr:hypothetical protein FDG2_5905 [Candidatus Protofrankia californiensis]
MARWSVPLPTSRWRPLEHRAPVRSDHGPWSPLPERNRVLRCEITGSVDYPEALGERLADKMLSAGAQTLMGNR